MTELPEKPLSLKTRRMLPLFIGLVAAGLAGNYFKFPIFLNIDFLFGSIFAMLALQFFGLGPGILAAAIISSYTYFLWNNPYYIIILTAEVGAVGWLMNRRNMGMVLADTVFWLAIGMPLVYFYLHFALHVPFSNTAIVMIKQSINGITNVLVARLIYIGFTLRLRASLTSFSEIVYNLLAFFVLCPALIMLAVSSRSDFAKTDGLIRTTLIQDSQHGNYFLDTWVANRASALVNLAEMAATISPRQMQSYLELAKKSDANFLRIGLLDKDATITAYYPLLDELGHDNIGKNFADRPFIPTLKQTLKPMLSEVVMGRIGVPKPMTTMLAPVVIQGEYGGYITGILSLEQIREHIDKSMHENATFYTLIDKNGNVIMTNRADQKVMTQFDRGSGTLHPHDSGISQWMPVMSPNTPILEQWKNSFYVAETTIGSLSEWKLILEQPVAPFQKALYDDYTGKLTLLFLILLGAQILAELLSRWSIVAFDKLRLITHDLPARLTTDGKEIAWPESNIKEANHLINNFREMTDSLTGQFNAVRQSQDALQQAYVEVELRVQERTAELDASNSELMAEIAERKRAEAEKEEMAARNRQLQKAESLGRMAGAIAHHFNNQLQAVMGNLEMAMDDLPLGVNPVASLVEAMQAARKAAEVSGLMLTYLGQSPGKRDPVDLSEVCRRSLPLLQAAAPNGVVLETDFPDSGPVIHANAGQIQQVLTHLATNAWEAVGQRHGTIGLTVKTVSRADIPASNRFPIGWQPRENDYACLEVAEKGCGITNTDIENLFDPFFTTKFTGRGLGLPVVLGIAGVHGGGITVESQPDQGSIFRVFLPLTTEKAPRIPEKTTKAAEIKGSGTVLLIEDEDQVRNMAAVMLSRLGYTVLEARDGIEAVEIFRQHHDTVRCVLSDLTMPHMDGWETLAALRRISPGIPVILSSGYDEAHVMAGEHPEWPQAFLGKPYGLKELCGVIGRLLS